MTYEPVPKPMARSLTIEGVHTGLRKGTDDPKAHDLWLAIREAPDAFGDACHYFVECLEYMGFAICKKEEG